MRKQQVYVKPEIKAAFEAMILTVIAKAQPHHHEIIPVPVLVFKNIGGCAGTCLYNHSRNNSVITMNPAYFQKPGGYDEQLNQTLPHEVAHHITDFIYRANHTTKLVLSRGRLRRSNNLKPHGPEWVRTMHWIGANPEVRHDMDTTGIVNRHERPFVYTCGCSEPIKLTARMHLSIKGGSIRRCRRCHKTIQFKGVSINGTDLLRAPAPVVEPEPVVVSEVKKLAEPKFKTVTRFINGSLQNVRISIDNP